jgi:hypothetical protein
MLAMTNIKHVKTIPLANSYEVFLSIGEKNE